MTIRSWELKGQRAQKLPETILTDKLKPDFIVQTTQYGVHCVFLPCVFTDFIKQSFASKYHPLITLRKNWKKSMLQDMDWISERSELFCCCPRNEI